MTGKPWWSYLLIALPVCAACDSGYLSWSFLYPRTVLVTPRCCWLVSQKQSRLWTKDCGWNDGSWWFMMVQLNNMSDFQKATALSNPHLSWLDPHFGSPFRCFNLSLCRLQVPILSNSTGFMMWNPYCIPYCISHISISYFNWSIFTIHI